MVVLIKVMTTAEINIEHSMSGFYIPLYGLPALNKIIKPNIYYRESYIFGSFPWVFLIEPYQKWGEVCRTYTNKNISETTFLTMCIPSTGIGVDSNMDFEEKSSLLRMHKALGFAGMVFLQKKRADLTYESWSYFFPTMMICSIGIQFGFKHSKRVCFRSPNPCSAFPPYV